MIKLKQLLFCEEIDENDIVVISKREGVSIMHRIVGSVRGSVASIDNVGNGQWWVSRVLVGDENERGKGIGSILLRRAIQEVLKHEPNALIIVEPGGSYGSNEERQINFYKKNGFVEVPPLEGVLMYKRNVVSEVIRGWKTPLETPNEVVRVLHIIVAALTKQGEDPNDYIYLYKKKHPKVGECWVIEQKNDPTGGVVYSVDKHKWFPFVGSGFDQIK